MIKFAYEASDGVLKEALELEILDKGRHVGWVPVETFVDFYYGKLSEAELKYEAQKQVMPSGKQESWDKILYINRWEELFQIF